MNFDYNKTFFYLQLCIRYDNYNVRINQYNYIYKFYQLYQNFGFSLAHCFCGAFVRLHHARCITMCVHSSISIIISDRAMPISRRNNAGLISCSPTVRKSRTPPSQIGFFGNHLRLNLFINPFSRCQRSLYGMVERHVVLFCNNITEHQQQQQRRPNKETQNVNRIIVSLPLHSPPFYELFVGTVPFNCNCCNGQTQHVYFA